MKMQLFQLVKLSFALYTLIIICFIMGCKCQNNDDNENLLFNAWYEEKFSPDDSITITSPNGLFIAEYVWENPDFSDKQMLLLASASNKRKIIIGRSTRGVKFHWVTSQIGDILLIEHLVDTHFTESFVIYPQISQKDKLSILILYATPKLNLYFGKIPPEYIYSSIEQVSFDGIMTISLSWAFANKNNENENVTYKIPLFYGM